MKKKALLIVAVALVAFMIIVPATVSAVGGDSGGIRFGTLTVVSNVGGANVSITASDGSHSESGIIGYGNLKYDSEPLDYEVPYYNVRVYMSGYESNATTVPGTYLKGTDYTVTVYLTPVVNDGFISVTSSPSDATIYIDGVRYGTTPETDRVTGNMTHTVKLVKSGYITQTQNIYVQAGTTQSVSMILSPSTTYGYLSVSSNPTGANIYVDGAYKGQAPMTITLPTGNHVIALSKSGYTGFQKTVTVYEGATSSVVGVLAENVTSAFVNISSTPAGASVYIDGEFLGITPSTGSLSKEVKANTNHTLVLKKDGYDSYYSTFNLSTGQIESFSPTLVASAPTKGTISVSSVPAGALVYIDNVYVGPSPVVEVVSAGTHTVKLASLGYNDSINTVTVSAGQTYPLQVTMTPGSSPSTKSPFPVLGLLIGLGAAAVFAGRKLRR